MDFGFEKHININSFGFNYDGDTAIENEANALYLATNLKTYLLFLTKKIDLSLNKETGLGMNFIT